MLKLPSRSGSLISPFQPTVVRGFSKYTRMTISSASPKRVALSGRSTPRVLERGRRDRGSSTDRSRRRGGRPRRAGCGAAPCARSRRYWTSIRCRAAREFSSAGVDSGAKLRMRKSSVCGGIFNLSQGARRLQDPDGTKKPPGSLAASGCSSLFSSSDQSRPVLRQWLRIAVKPEVIAGPRRDHGRH